MQLEDYTALLNHGGYHIFGILMFLSSTLVEFFPLGSINGITIKGVELLVLLNPMVI